MKKFIGTALVIIGGFILIPSLFIFALGVFATFWGYMASPKAMLVICITLGIISLPGIIIGWLAKR